MGLIAETNVLNQLKKGQGETNQRLDALLAAQQETNRLLSALLAALHPAQPQAVQQPSHYPPQPQHQQWGGPPRR